MKISFFDTKPYDREIFTPIAEQFGYEIKYFKFNITPENAVLAQGTDVVCAFVNDIISAEVIEKLKSFGIKLIALRSAGFNNVDLKAAQDQIPIVRVPAYSPHAVAEHAIALMLTLNRKIHRAYFRTRDTNFSLHGLMGFDMYQKTAGVVGTGKIGKVLIQLLRGFGMEVLMSDPYPDKDFEKASGARYTTNEELFKKSDVISLNCPLTPETEYLINKDALNMMKNGVMLINTGRGKLIKTFDLIEGLKEGIVGAAGLDVYEEEAEYFFEDRSDDILTDDILARLLTFNNVIITSHQAFFTKEAMHNIAETTLNNIKEFDEGKPLTNEVKFQA